jgi:hypothetical protein
LIKNRKGVHGDYFFSKNLMKNQKSNRQIGTIAAPPSCCRVQKNVFLSFFV